MTIHQCIFCCWIAANLAATNLPKFTEHLPSGNAWNSFHHFQLTSLLMMCRGLLHWNSLYNYQSPTFSFAIRKFNFELVFVGSSAYTIPFCLLFGRLFAFLVSCFLNFQLVQSAEYYSPLSSKPIRCHSSCLGSGTIWEDSSFAAERDQIPLTWLFVATNLGPWNLQADWAK